MRFARYGVGECQFCGRVLKKSKLGKVSRHKDWPRPCEGSGQLPAPNTQALQHSIATLEVAVNGGYALSPAWGSTTMRQEDEVARMVTRANARIVDLKRRVAQIEFRNTPDALANVRGAAVLA